MKTNERPLATQIASTSWQRWLLSVVAVELTLLAAWLARELPLPVQLGFVLGFSSVSASALLVSWSCPLFPRRALTGALLPASALVALSLSSLQGLPLVLLVNAMLLLGATLVGNVIGNAIEHPGQLVFVAVVGSAMDVLSVLHPSGVSATIAESEAALSVIALAWPLLGTHDSIPLLGAGDIVFTALYLAASRRHGLSLARAVLALAAGYLLTLACVLLLERSLPALPFLGAAFVLALPEARRPSREDRKRGTLIAAGVVACVSLLLVRAL